MNVRLSVGFIPLLDMAPLAVARELGFAAEEGLELDLVRAPSWSMLRDMLALGHVAAAQMLSPVPVAMALGLGGMTTRVDALSVLSVNGDVVGVSRELAARLRDCGHDFGFNDARAAGMALAQATGGQLRLGVPFPFSMHAELIWYWLGSLGLPRDRIDVRSVPPPQMAQAMADGEIDAFCVGEPWGSIAVENGVGELLLPGAAIWAFAPEKVLAVRHDWAEAEPDLTARLMRAVWRANRWLGDRSHRAAVSELLARSEYVNVSAEILDRALSGQLVISPSGELRNVPGFIEFFAGAATFPWRSQAAWIGSRLAGRLRLDRAQAAEQAQALFRTDLYRRNLRGAGADLPGASAKVEGSLAGPTAVASEHGAMILHRDVFFDGAQFDPAER